jgi:hypothetical protein
LEILKGHTVHTANYRHKSFPWLGVIRDNYGEELPLMIWHLDITYYLVIDWEAKLNYNI